MNIYEQKKQQFDTWSERLMESDLAGPWQSAVQHMIEADYFNAPASTRFHLSVKGGLLIHSVCVVELALRIHEVVPMTCPWTHIVAGGLLHDVAKAGLITPQDGHMPRYVPNPKYNPRVPSKWAGAYEYRAFDPEFNIRDLSALLVAKWGFPWEVIQAVLVHDGAYVEPNKDYMGKNTPLAALLMAADTMQAQQFETTQGIVPLNVTDLAPKEDK